MPKHPLRQFTAALFAAVLCTAPAAAPPSQWQGAAFAGDRATLEKLAAAGGRVVRVYHHDTDAWVLDEAARLGLKVVMGLWVAHPRHGFRIDDAAAVAAQERDLRAFVERHRNHPALLAWGVGNEVEIGERDPLPMWREIDRLAGIVKRLDPAHPTLMSVADTGDEQLRLLADCCASVDLLGINLYGGAVFALPGRLRAAAITKPVVVTEFGPLGQWQAGRKPWGAPVEPTSTEKAAFYREALAFLARQPQVTGSFPFLWGAKQEQTGTWHG
ncbi:glycoside hydrolase family 2 TIM barrel-domain containing protein, partial [Thauera phenolivorans]